MPVTTKNQKQTKPTERGQLLKRNTR